MKPLVFIEGKCRKCGKEGFVEERSGLCMKCVGKIVAERIRKC